MSVSEESQKSVLLVEDDVEMRAQLEAIVALDGCLNLTASCATLSKAMQLVEHTPPDILISDIVLPDGEGFTVIKEVRARNPQAVILVISVLGDEIALTTAIAAGADGYLLKDASAPDVLAAIHEAEAGGAPISAMMARHLLNRLIPREKDESAGLTNKEAHILEVLSRGYTYRETAELVGISPHTMTSHIKNIYRKLQVHSGQQAVMEGLRRGIIEIPQ